ncbi:cobyrinate a,c-diamide synthase [Azotosporobacter soli]|uniref:cobyrinate a,c-diamide synthase n=1 Tax=Azotosporobacter soli TaxID=3055040 RepID=UPI003D161121
MMSTVPRLVIAGTQSGVGKTTIVAGLLAAFRARKQKVQSYKIGPDYIDPGYHQQAGGKPSYNLDSWLMPEVRIANLLEMTAKGQDLALIEGVMGLYDGGKNGISSTAQIAKRLQAPVVLVLDVKSAGESAAAVACGFKEYDPDVNFAGVILNRVGSHSHRQMVEEALQRRNIPVFGAVYRDGAIQLPERHLGLTPVNEHDSEAIMLRLQAKIEAEIDVSALMKLGQSAPPFEVMQPVYPLPNGAPVRIAVAQDEAFSFYYPDSLAVLNGCGAELIPFSPVRDAKLPEKIDGLLLGGGFPEMFLVELAANEGLRKEIKAEAQKGMPVYAECGGLMYLCREIADFTGHSYPMCNVVPARSEMRQKLQTVGYVEATALSDSILSQKGEKLRGHEFHFSEMIPDADFNWAFSFSKLRTGAVYCGGFCQGNVLASYLHLHFAGNEMAASRFIEKCRDYQRQQGGHNG